MSILSMLRDWHRAAVVKRDKADWSRGYEYAAGRILSGMATVDELMLQSNLSNLTGYTQFDVGIRDACLKAVAQGAKVMG